MYWISEYDLQNKNLYEKQSTALATASIAHIFLSHREEEKKESRQNGIW